MEKTEFLKIGVSGGGYDGNFSEKAANYFFNKNNNFELVYLCSVNEVIRACIKREIDKGIFPIETPVGGIKEAVYAMSNYIFNVEDIFKFEGRFCLLVGPAPIAPIR